MCKHHGTFRTGNYRSAVRDMGKSALSLVENMCSILLILFSNKYLFENEKNYVQNFTKISTIFN